MNKEMIELTRMLINLKCNASVTTAELTELYDGLPTEPLEVIDILNALHVVEEAL